MPIRAALFDIGRVVVGFNTRIVSHQLTAFSPLPELDINTRIFRVYRSGKRNKLLEDFEEGHITPIQFYEQIRTLINLDSKLTFEEFVRIWTSMLYQNRGINQIIVDLEARGVTCIAITNTDPLIWDWMTRNIKAVGEHFSDRGKQVLSFQTGFPKPAEVAWVTALTLAGCPAEQVVYVDDIQDLLTSFEQFCATRNYGETHTIQYNYDREPIEFLRKKLTQIGAL